MQPSPAVTDADVERVVQRDFAVADLATARAILAEYGMDREPEAARVRLAALKQAGGNLHALRRHVDIAKKDYRDVLSAAESPRASREWTRLDKKPPGYRQSVYDEDWQQYKDWLSR